MKSRVLLLAAAAAVAFAGVWYFASLGYAMSQLRDAAIEGDADELEERIDFVQVRESLKSEMRAAMASEMARADGEIDGFTAFGSMMVMAMIEPMVDGIVNANSMSAMIQQGKLQSEGDAPAEETESVSWSIERDGLDTFRATPERPEGERVPTLVFERDGLGWRLAEIDLPEGGLGGDTSS